MNKLKVKQISAIATLLGVVMSGFGGLFGHEEYRVLQEGSGMLLTWIGDRAQNIGNFLMIIAPVILILSDWRNIFPINRS